MRGDQAGAGGRLLARGAPLLHGELLGGAARGELAPDVVDVLEHLGR